MDVIDATSFGDMLKSLRKKKRISQQKLAIKLGVHPNTISKWERGICLPDSKGIVLEVAKQLRLQEQEARQLLDASLTALSPYWQVPYQRNPFFTGRATFLQTLHERLGAQQVVALSQSYALSGLGGVGKTQLALAYVYQHALDYRAIFWIAAETIDTINTSFTSIAEQMHLPEREEEDHQEIVKAVLRWLATHKEWLLIFDNVEATSLLKPFLPSARQGAILITTRLHSLEGLAQVFELPPFSSREGVFFLLRRARILTSTDHFDSLFPDLVASAYALVEVMDGLPLALDQAGAYIERTGCSLPTYLRMFKSDEIQLLSERSEIADHPHSVVKTILLSFQRLNQINSVSADLLRLCAFLAPDAIPEELFTGNADSLGSVLSGIINDTYHFNLALGEALQYSLLYRQSQYHTLSQHRLVQVILKSTMDEPTARLWAFRVATLISNCVTPTQGKNSEVHDDRYLPHARSVLLHIQQWGDWKEQPVLASIWYYIGRVAEQYSQLMEAKNAYLQGLKSAHLSHSPLEAAFLVHIGLMISDLGDDQSGLQYLEQGADLARQLHDEETLCFALLNEGQIQDNFGHYQTAEALYLETKSIALRIHDWTITSICLQDLGVQAVRRGDYELAETLYHEGLLYARQSAQLTRQSSLFMNLGMLAIHQQQYEQALTYSLKSLDYAQQVHNRYRISSVSQNLAIIYRLLGQLDLAQSYLDESLRLAQEIQNLWLIAETQGEYGRLLLERRQSSDAKEMFELMLAGARHIQSPELIAWALFGLAQVAAQQNCQAQVKTFAQESLEIFIRLENAQSKHIAQWLDTF